MSLIILPLGIQQTIFEYLNKPDKIKLLNPICNNVINSIFLIETFDDIIETIQKNNEIIKKYNMSEIYYCTDLECIEEGHHPCDECNIIHYNEYLYMCTRCHISKCKECHIKDGMEFGYGDCKHSLWISNGEKCFDCLDNVLTECVICDSCNECHTQYTFTHECTACDNKTCDNCYDHSKCDGCDEVLCKKCYNQYEMECIICNEYSVKCGPCIESTDCPLCIQHTNSHMCDTCHFNKKCDNCGDDERMIHCRENKKLLCNECYGD
jgi:hypothetical protein